jgi:hypothetical protein
VRNENKEIDGAEEKMFFLKKKIWMNVRKLDRRGVMEKSSC